MLHFPISLLLCYHLAKKAMEYQYLLALAHCHGVFVDQVTGHTLTAPDPIQSDTLPNQSLKKLSY